MKISDFQNMTGGWFAGDFDPAGLWTKDAECGVKRYRAGDYEPRHVHKVVTEVTLLLEGRAKMNGVELQQGKIVALKPGESTDFLALTDAVTVVMKTPSRPRDKHVFSPRLISHRGNLNGKSSATENSPKRIMEVLDLGFDVEIDVWSTEDGLRMGHDYPNWPILENRLLVDERVWCHAKDLDSLCILKDMGAHTFYHHMDNAILTSRGFVWLYPGKRPKVGNKDCVVLLPEVDQWIIPECYAICTDYPMRLVAKV